MAILCIKVLNYGSFHAMQNVCSVLIQINEYLFQSYKLFYSKSCWRNYYERNEVILAINVIKMYMFVKQNF